MAKGSWWGKFSGKIMFDDATDSYLYGPLFINITFY